MALLGGISGSAPRAYRSFVEGISVATAVVWIMWQSPINWRPSTRDVAIGVIVTAFLFALQHCNEISVASKTRISWVFAPLGIAAAQLLLHRLMPRNVIELILRFGEDNAIFLNNAALLHQGGVVDEQSGNHSAALSVVQSLRETLLRGGGPGPIGLLSFESLFAVYLLVISLLLYVASDFLIQERRNRPVGTSAFFIFLFISLPLLLGLVRFGHLSALVAVLFLSATNYPAASLGDSQCEPSQQWARPATFVSSAVCLVAASSAWFPLRFVLVPALFAISLLQIRELGVTAKQHNHRRNKPLGLWISVGLFVCLVLYLFLRDTWWLYDSLKTLDFSWLTKQISLGGGNATIDAPIVFMILLFALIHAWRDSREFHYGRIITTCCAAGVVVLTLLGWSSGPEFSPTYGVQKFQYIISFGLLPAAIKGLLDVATASHDRKSRVTRLVVLLFVFLSFNNPLSQLSVLGGSAQIPFYAKGVQALLQVPNKVPICIESSEDSDRELDAYTCTRLALGATGHHLSPLINLSGANVCWSDSATIESLKEDLDGNLAVLLFDEARVYSDDGCMSAGWSGRNTESDPRWSRGWATGLPLRSAQFFGIHGQQVDPSQLLID